MYELATTISDPDVILALEPEELAAILLPLLRRRLAREPQGHVHPGTLVNEVGYSDASRGVTGFPRERRDELKVAVSEALAWLIAQGLLVPTIKQTNAGWMTLSRRAARMESATDFIAFVDARRLNRDLLHPSIRDGVWLSFVRGEFAEAVFKAMRAVEIAVREAAGFPEGDHGVPMIRRAFHKDTGPLRDPNQEEAEREALAHLFAGAVGSYKNPHSHRAAAMDDAGEAIEVVMLASHLLRIADARAAAAGGAAP